MVIGASGRGDVQLGSIVAPLTKLLVLFVFRGVYPKRIDWPNLPSKITSPRYGCNWDRFFSSTNPFPKSCGESTDDWPETPAKAPSILPSPTSDLLLSFGNALWFMFDWIPTVEI